MVRSWGGKWDLLLILKPQQYKILRLCGFTILLSALKAVFSHGFSFKIYVCEERADEGCAWVLHLFCLTAVYAPGVEATALGRSSIDVCKSVVMSVGGGKKRHRKHEPLNSKNFSQELSQVRDRRRGGVREKTDTISPFVLWPACWKSRAPAWGVLWETTLTFAISKVY